MKDELPEKIKRIDILRVEHGLKKLCQCHSPKYTVDSRNRLVYCKCGAIVDPFDALEDIARNYERLGDQVEYLLEQRRQIVNYKPRLKVIKDIAEHYTRNHPQMLPRCPHCDKLFELQDIRIWSNRMFYKPPEEDE